MIELRRALPEDKEALISLWLSCFDEEPRAAELFFDRIALLTHGYVAVDEKTPVAAVYLADCLINGEKSHYLCGAATIKSRRGEGIMTGLIGFALDDARARGDVYSTLMPANDGLYEFYSGFGYERKCHVRRTTILAADIGDCSKKIASKNFEISHDFSNIETLERTCLKENYLFQSRKFMEFAAEYYAVYDIKCLCDKECFALVEDNGETAEVFYSLCADFEQLKKRLCESLGAKRFTFTGKRDGNIYTGKNDEKYGMIKLLDEARALPEDVYLGITLG